MPADIAKGNEKLNMGFTAAIFNALPGLAASAGEGVFNPALAASHAIIKDGGCVVRLNEQGCALFGNKMEPNTGIHWAVLKVVEADAVQCYMGLMPADCNKNGIPGMEQGTTALEATGTEWFCVLGGSPLFLHLEGTVLGVSFGAPVFIMLLVCL